MLLQLLKAAKSFSAVWQDGKPELAKDVLAGDVVSKDLLFGNETKGYDSWSKMVHGIFEVRPLLLQNPSYCCGWLVFCISTSMLIQESQTQRLTEEIRGKLAC